MYKKRFSGIRRMSLAACCCALAGCAAEQAAQHPPEVPRSQEATCGVVGVEARAQPLQQNADTMALQAVVTLPDADTPPPKERLALISTVNRSRTDEPEDLFEGPPEQLCPPDTNAHSPAPVTPFSPTPVVGK
jgi:hypothetical protein